jgi:hypothetical protein
MKPLHAATRRLSRCPCCQSKGSKRNGKQAGKKSARAKAKLEAKRNASLEIRD